MSLDAFVSSSRPPPEAIATSQEIRDRSSLFVASIFRVRSVAEARAAQAHMQRAGGQKPPTHAMYAWRYMALKKGKTGLAGEDDFECVSGSEDDGERYGGARILKVRLHTRRTPSPGSLGTGDEGGGRPGCRCRGFPMVRSSSSSMTHAETVGQVWGCHARSVAVRSH
jgi:putative IMPACT (imprinted ancient) family translation regulator